MFAPIVITLRYINIIYKFAFHVYDHHVIFAEFPRKRWYKTTQLADLLQIPHRFCPYILTFIVIIYYITVLSVFILNTWREKKIEFLGLIITKEMSDIEDIDLKVQRLQLVIEDLIKKNTELSDNTEILASKLESNITNLSNLENYASKIDTIVADQEQKQIARDIVHKKLMERLNKLK